MLQHINITNEFPHVAFTLKGLLTEIQAGIAELLTSSPEAFDDARRVLVDSHEHWPEVVGAYKAAVQNMPKTLRRRDFVEQSLTDIDACDTELKKFIDELKEMSFADFKVSLDTRLQELEVSVKDLQARFRETVKKIDEVQEQSVMQRYLGGEQILSGRENLQWRRKIFHTLSGVFFVYFMGFSGFPQKFTTSVAILIAVLTFTLEASRLISKRVNKLVWRVFGAIMREREKNRISSASYYLVSIALVYLVFPIEVSVLAVMFLALGDTVAGIVGSNWGRTRLRNHVSLEGFAACGIVCMIISFYCAGFVFEKTLPFIPLVLFAHVGGLIGAIAEASFKNLDDNLVIPVVSAPLLWVMMQLFGIL